MTWYAVTRDTSSLRLMNSSSTNQDNLRCLLLISEAVTYQLTHLG
jgi:hypothetical protein